MTTKVNAIEIDKAKIMLPIPQKLYVTKICKQQMTNEKYYCFGIRGFQKMIETLKIILCDPLEPWTLDWNWFSFKS